jgi:hypothetical protein
MGRPVASRASFTPASTTRVPLTPIEILVSPGGAISTNRSASATTGSLAT